MGLRKLWGRVDKSTHEFQQHFKRHANTVHLLVEGRLDQLDVGVGGRGRSRLVACQRLKSNIYHCFHDTCRFTLPSLRKYVRWSGH